MYIIAKITALQQSDNYVPYLYQALQFAKDRL